MVLSLPEQGLVVVVVTSFYFLQKLRENWINLTMGDGVFVLQASIVILIILYGGVVQESTIGADGRSPHSAWRNYDDFNEFFWYLC
jgi:hypothetical protein